MKHVSIEQQNASASCTNGRAAIRVLTNLLILDRFLVFTLLEESSHVIQGCTENSHHKYWIETNAPDGESPLVGTRPIKLVSRNNYYQLFDMKTQARARQT